MGTDLVVFCFHSIKKDFTIRIVYIGKMIGRGGMKKAPAKSRNVKPD